MKFAMQYGAMAPMDFRSAEFRDAAQMLVQTTGCALVLCRQELFIAEGDMEQARMALQARKASEIGEQVRH